MSAVAPGVLMVRRGRLLSRSPQEQLVLWGSALFSVSRPQLRRPAEGMSGKPGYCDQQGPDRAVLVHMSKVHREEQGSPWGTSGFDDEFMSL